MGLKEMLDETKEEALNQAKKAIIKYLKPLLIKGLAVVMIVVLVASASIAVFDSLGDVISGIITGTINAINSIESKFSRWLINTGIQDESNNYWTRLDTPYSEADEDIEIKYEGEKTAVYLKSNTETPPNGASTNAVSLLNGNLAQFEKDDNLGIYFTNIYGLDVNYKKTDLEATYVVGFGKEGIALFDYGGTLKAVNKEVNDIEFIYLAITDTGFVLANTDKTKLVTYDFKLNITSRDVTGRTLPDLYLEQLYSTGLSLDNLRVLVGGVDEKLSVDEILADEEQKEKAEKYIKEFLRADLVSSSTHKTDSKVNIDPNNSDMIDGGIYVWRTNTDMYEWNEEKIESDAALKGSENPEVQKMIFVPYDVFHATYEEDMGNGEKELNWVYSKGWARDYTINENGDIEVFVFDLSYEGNENVPLANLFGRPLNTHARIATIDYKEYVKEYTMPFEFLMSVAYVCENPEYAYHLAFMARETMIDIVICDEYEIQYENYEKRGYKLNTDRERRVFDIENGTTTEVLSLAGTLEDSREPGGDGTISLGAATKFHLVGNVDAFVIRADAWDKYFQETLYRKGIQPTVEELNRTNLNEEVGEPEPYEIVGNQYISPVADPNGGRNVMRYDKETGTTHTFMTSEIGTTKSYRVEYDTKKVIENGDAEGNKYKVFYGLLREKRENKAEDKCETEEDVIEHLKDIEASEDGFNTFYKLQKIGIHDKPINVMVNERGVLYRQIETFGNAFNKKEITTGEREYNSEDNSNTGESTSNNESDKGTNYDWLYDYLDTAFGDMHIGKFQEIETLPPGFGALYGDWADPNSGNPNPSGSGANPGEIPPPGERVDESNFIQYYQWDPRWEAHPYYRCFTGEWQTFHHHGCMLVAMTMIIRNLYGMDYTPDRLYDQYLASDKPWRSHSGMVGMYGDMYGDIYSMCLGGGEPITYNNDQEGLNKALEDVSKGSMAIISAYYGANGDNSKCHAIVLSAYDEAGVHIHDPWSTDGTSTIVSIPAIATPQQVYWTMVKANGHYIKVFPPR